MSRVVRQEPADPQLLERSYQRVRLDQQTGCHVWTGSRNRDGHGTIKHGRQTFYVHRLTWLAVFGKLPPRRLVLRPSATTPPASGLATPSTSGPAPNPRTSATSTTLLVALGAVAAHL